MEAKKTAIIVFNMSVGFIVFLIGLEMFPFPLNLLWVVFNVWLWIVPVTALFWAKKKEEKKKQCMH